ncbi:MAG: hypothetical protein FWF05_06475 [Oscillospiraceae bacterium]|nr:hypothetical protein [Oscillospiraceae bacterium]
MKITKAPETMTAKQRVKKTFNHEKTDRVTIGYDANSAINRRVCEALGVSGGEELLRALGVDYRSVGAPYTGPDLFPEKPGRRVSQTEGSYTRWVEHGTGGYWDFCDFPLKDADAETIAGYPVPSPDDFDYDAVAGHAARFKDYGLYVGGPGIPDIINSNGRIFGMEDILVHLLTENEAAMNFMDRRVDFNLKYIERVLDKAKGQLDFIWLGEDLGTQIAPMISLDLFRRVFRPRHQKFIDLGNAYGVPCMIHTCGSSSWAYEDFIEMGMRGVDTLQPEAANMSPRYLKEHFGGRLTFRGCISTAGPVAYGTAEDTTRICRETLEIMMDGYGYHFAPAHAIQDNTPVENVIAMYQAAHDFGRYS